MNALAIDIEKLGDYQDAHIIAVGFCFGDSDGNVIERKAWYISPNERTVIEDRCKREFWDKQTGLYDYFVSQGRPAHIVYPEIAAWLATLEAKYPKIVILSDNPSYDLGGFDRMLQQYTDRLPLRYTSSHGYRWVADYSERAYALGIENAVSEAAKKRMGMTEEDKHRPEKDAEFIYHCTCIVDAVIKKKGAEIAKICSEAL
nr:hypothetical protein K-LCC10_0184 [Kaumoebavirus]